jgi:hypothetical protein
MAVFNKETKSNRLLQSKRYTIAETTPAEAYTRVIDLNASEIYIQEAAITSSGLPYSGSGQNNLTLNSGSSNQTISKFYFRFPLTPSATKVDSNTRYNTYFFISGSGYTPGISTNANPQVVQPFQQTNFISNKYADPSLATATTEDGINEGGTGYNVVVSTHGSDAPNSATKVDGDKYEFDYKTGVLQFTSNTLSDLPTISTHVYITVYQYLGQTLDSFVAALSGSSGGGGTPGGATTQVQFNDGGAFAGSERLTFNKSTGLTRLSGSFELTGSVDNIFLIKSGSIDLLRMSSSGALVFGDLNHVPPPVAGGFYYSSGEFYVGTE